MNHPAINVVAWSPLSAGARGDRAAESAHARCVLTRLLGEFLGPDAASARLLPAARFRKPGLAPPFDAVHVNLTHGGEIAACVVSTIGPCGVDVESLQRDEPWIDTGLFTPGERAWLARNTEPGAFNRFWTVKEAYLKATGEGLARMLDSFEVQVEPAAAIRVDTVDGGTILCERRDVSGHSLAAVILAPPGQATARVTFRQLYMPAA